MNWYVARLLAALPTQLLLITFSGPTRDAAAPPGYWKLFDLGGVGWLLLWSWVLRHQEIRSRWKVSLLLVAIVPMLLFPLHAYTVVGATASSLGHIPAFLAANGAAFLAAHLFQKHVKVGVLYLVLFAVFFSVQVEAFSYLHLKALGLPPAMVPIGG